MQGIAAHDAIGIEEAHTGAQAEARFARAGSPPPRLAAKPVKPEPHGPSVIERELGEGLHPDRSAQLGHPGVECYSLPAAHAHRLPQYKDARELQHPEEAEAPLLVQVEAAAVVTEEEAPQQP